MNVYTWGIHFSAAANKVGVFCIYIRPHSVALYNTGPHAGLIKQSVPDLSPPFHGGNIM